MRPIFLACACVVVAAMTAASPAVVASSSAKPKKVQQSERRIDATGFTGVTLEGGMNVIIEHGARTEVIARGSMAALADLDPEVEKGILRLKEKKGILRERLRVKSDVVTITITMPKLKSFSLAGAGDVTFKNVIADDLDLKIAGSGSITANGSCRKLNISLAGSGDIDAKNFRCEAVTVKITGSGDVSTYASRDFTARIMGAGSIDVYGNPENRSRSVFGAGDITYHK